MDFVSAISDRPFLKGMALCFSLGLLVGCDADIQNHKTFRKTLEPLHQQLDVGMTSDELETLLVDYPNVESYIYPYTEDHALDFDSQGQTLESQMIFQLSMEGDPADAGVQSICFIKLLTSEAEAGEQQIIEVTSLSCPA